MAEILQKYMDGTNLALSTAVFEDANLTVLAADGWYSDGLTTRYQLLGVLQDPEDCPNCFSPCDAEDQSFPRTQDVTPATPSATIYEAQAGTYNIPFSAGSEAGGEGAIIWRVYLKNATTNPSSDYSSPWGMIAYMQQAGITTFTSNNFSSSGTNVVSPGDVGGNVPVQNGPAGTVGSTKRINDTALTDDTKAVYVGRKNTFGVSPMSTADPFTASCQPGVYLPNNTPYTAGIVALSLTRTNYPSYWYHWPANEFQLGGGNYFPNKPSTESFTASTEQVQIGPSTDATTGQGYRGWLTCVIPKTNQFEDRSLLKLFNPQCENGATVAVMCPVKLDPISVSPPGDSLGEICGLSTLNEVIYNVPGCSGYGQAAPNVIFQFGVPNLGDIMCSGENGEPLAPAQKNKFYKYMENGDPKAFFVDEDSIVSQTSISCVGGNAAFDTVYEMEDTGIGGGLYRSAYTLPVLSTGAVIVRVFTGNNPKGLIVTHYNNDGTIAGKTNLFSVRGANADNMLEEDAYNQYLDPAIINNLGAYIYWASGCIWGGNALKMGGKNADGTAAYVPLTAASEVNGEEWPSQIAAQLVIYENNNLWECDTPNSPYPCYINCQGNETDVALVTDNPVYIGLAGFSGSAIPCTHNDNGVSTIDCSAGFSPASGGPEDYVNVETVIPLPANGNHEGPIWTDIIPDSLYGNNDIAEAMFGLTTYCALYPNESDWYDLGMDWLIAERYPNDSTNCPECMYSLKALNSITGTYSNLNDQRRFYITPPQVQLYKPDSNMYVCTPGWSMAVIPLTGVLASTEAIELDIYSITSNTSFKIYVDTPAALPAAPFTLYGPHPLSDTDGDIGAMCTAGQGSGTTATCYVAANAWGGDGGPCIPGNPNVAGTPCATQASVTNEPRVNDMVFSDSNGATRLPTGRYYYNTAAVLPDTTGNRIIEVDEFGIVTCWSICQTGTYPVGGCDIF